MEDVVIAIKTLASLYQNNSVNLRAILNDVLNVRTMKVTKEENRTGYKDERKNKTVFGK